MSVEPTKRRVLVFGGGYLGYRLYQGLLEQGNDVVLCDLLSFRCSDPSWRVDIADHYEISQLARLLNKKRPELIYLCVSTKGGDAEKCRRTYLEGVANVIEYFPSVRIVYCSSTALYGEEQGGWVDETAVLHPANDETGVLLQTEQMVRRTGGLVGRLSAIYGPGRCVLLERLRKEGKPISGAPDRWLNYIHRDDAVAALMLLGKEERDENLVNISDGHPMTLENIYQSLSGMLGIPVPECIPRIEGRRRGKTNQRVSSSLLQSYGWTPRYPDFVSGVRNIINENTFLA